MNSREKLTAALNHQECGHIPFDMGATKATGISASLLYRLRKLYGREEPVKIYDTYQMLGLIDEKDAEMFGIDVLPLWPDMTIYGYRNTEWKSWTTPDGTPALIGAGCGMKEIDRKLYMYPQGDLSARPSGCMPLDGGHYFDFLTRQDPYDEDNLNGYEDYKEQLELMTIDDETLKYFEDRCNQIANSTDCGMVLNAEYANFGSQSMLNGAYAKVTPGVRDFSEFLVTHHTDPEYIEEIYEAWTKVCIRNLELLHQAVGEKVQAVFLSGTDFGTQHSEIMSKKMFQDLYVPYYSRVNGWVHEHTTWKTLFHTCGSLVNILDDFVDCGLDCLNPIQTSADGMDPEYLKNKYNKDLVFWGGGVDSQTTITHGTPDDVEKEMRKRIEIFGKDGGFVFSVVHNIQDNVNLKNVQRILDVLKEYR